MSYLVILESPNKIGTIKSYLGSNYRVIASKGHVRDLPKSSLGVDIENNFEPHYINIRGRGDLIRDIRKEAKAASRVYLATDPDREGEAISWHLATVLGIPTEKVMRVSFNEITKAAVKAAIKSPRPLDMNQVNAQQARRILDRIVGYKISPLLWKNVQSGLSAGRVQSVAERMIVEREQEIRAFVPEEYWTVDAQLECPDDSGRTFSVHYVGNRGGRVRLGNENDAMAIAKAAAEHPFVVREVKKSTRNKLPAPPFTTSTMQQEASRKLGFQSQRIMRVAQELYEGINLGAENGGAQGLITYMRTDSLRVSAEAQEAARAYIGEKYGTEYYPESPRQYKSRAGAQDAHEAIRPARVDLEPLKIRKMLTPDQYRLYKLIWERFVASQMQSATLAVVSVDLECAENLFHAGGYSVTFPGYMALYEETEEESGAQDGEPKEEKDARIPALEAEMSLHCEGVSPEQHFTEPPARFNEGSLIKALEDKGIGRPSTFTPIITTILERGYVKREGKALMPTPLGEVTTGLMEKHFPSIVDYGFTADMENRLDDIEKGETTMDHVLAEFWQPFSKQLETAEEKLRDEIAKVPVEETDLICDKCGSRMIVKKGRFGKFAACPNYPTCRSTKPLVSTPTGEMEGIGEVVEGMKCELCGGEVVLRTGRYGAFYACARYPECKFTKPKDKEIGVDCPKCGKPLVSKLGKKKSLFYGCSSYPACDFSSWDLPTNEKCPRCGEMLFRKKSKGQLICHNETCGYTVDAPETDPGESEGEQ
ncbi:MAG: type I DNA topoisomerase [Clostridia bacterium]|nr:type I DNA topoisomerase [Clostridia bacterium]